jgi:hypothetical protein
MLGAAVALREIHGIPQPIPEREDTEAAVARAWAAAFAAGKALTLEQAIAEALETTGG